MNTKVKWVGSIAAAIAVGLGMVVVHSHSDAAGHHDAPSARGLHGSLHPSSHAGASSMYAEREFEFDLPGTVVALTPYFGPVKEREWAPDWQPEFVRPAAGGQEVGTVFQTTSEWGRATWVMDRYQPEQGRVGYLIFIPDTGVTRYDITLSQKEPATVHVHVWCSRTLLKNADAAYLVQFEQSFAAQGPEWQEAITGMLAHASAQPH